MAEQRLTPSRPRPWKAPFLEALAERGIVLDACKAAGISRALVYGERSEDAEFALAWEDAHEIAMDRLEQEAFRRAREGVERGVWHQGVEVGRERHYSDTLLMFLLNGGRPTKYRQRGQVEVTVKSGDQAADVIAAMVDA